MKPQHLLLSGCLILAGSASAAMTWTHPGTLDGTIELEYVKTRLAAKAEPYTFEFQTMRNNEGGLSKAPAPQVTIDANSGAADAARDDARRAYGNALAWKLTGDKAYADQAVAYLKAWSVLQSITATNDQKKLVGGWLGSLWGPAADLMLGYPGWAAADVEAFRAMLKRAFYPVLNTASTWNGNVDLHQICAMLALAVVNEDEAEFQLGLTRLSKRIPAYFYLESDGTPPAISGSNGDIDAFWSNPTKWVDGLTQETCRDNNHHAQFAMSGALGAMEIAWHQGVDVYSLYQARMVPAMELMGLQSFSGSMQGTCANNTASADVYDTWEIGYNHFHGRLGLALPNTLAMIRGKVRSYASNPGSWNIFYESLTHADIVQPATGIGGRPAARGQDPSAIALRADGVLEIRADRDDTWEVSVRSLDGAGRLQVGVALAAGQTRRLDLGKAFEATGLGLVQVRSSQGTKVLLLPARHP